MSSYQGSATVHAGARAVFEFVSNVENISSYVSCISQADAGVDDAIHISGECLHGPFRGVGSFHRDEENLRLRWDSRANLHYRGSLQIIDEGERCEVTIYLGFDPGLDTASNRDFDHLLKEHPPAMQKAVEEALARIRAHFEEALTPA